MRWTPFLLFLPLAAQPDDAFFEKKIRPVLAEHCYSCHSTKAKIAFADLRLDTPAALRTVTADPKDSRLLKALLYDGPVKMPPSGKLPAAVIGDFQSWISAGARFPDHAAPVTAKAATPGLDHWAWKPPVKPAGTIDSLIQSRLAAQNLHQNPPAPPETLLRRLTLDLTGLPPTPAQLQAFLKNPNLESLVDQLLASPAFGQRWGRHWLDQTYFADTIEIGRRVPARHAWRYRDYVVDAFNRDTPYNRFILEQLAGDHLEWKTPEERRANLTATGFLALGPWPLVNADKEQLKMDVVDLQVDLTGRTFLGLTTGCTRCHDHKFDPISTRDYYGMAGVFASTRTLSGRLGLSVFSNVNTVPLPELPAELAARAAETREYFEKLESARAELETVKKRGKEAQKEITAATQAVKLLEYLPVVPPTAHAVQDAETPADIRINLRGNAHQLGPETPRSAIALFGKSSQLDIPDFTSGRKELAEWIASKDNPLTARVMANRVWHHLFGAGIVPTIDNFGTRGAAPSHPELLDLLATDLVANNWSIKKLVRQIVLSKTYALSSAPNEAALQSDPENRLLWRTSRRRLEAETIRDAMLSVSGELDPRPAGPSLPFSVKGNMNLGQPEFFSDDAKLDPADRLRRTVFLPVLRKNQAAELDVLNLFNFPDPNQVTGARQSTTIPTQALFLLNAPFVLDRANALAERLQAMDTSNAQRLDSLLRRLYARPPKPGEIENLLQQLPQLGWPRLCHTLLISNEFLYRS